MSRITAIVVEAICLSKKIDNMPTVFIETKQDLNKIARVIGRPIIRVTTEGKKAMLYVFDGNIKYFCGDDEE